MPRLVLLAFLLVPSLASARLHLALRRSEPANDSRLVASPTRVSLWFTERPTLAFSRIGLVGTTGAIALDALVADSGNALHAGIPRALAPGTYRVQWQTASADGHPIRGDFGFTIAGNVVATATPPADTPGAGPALATTEPDPDDLMGFRTARWIEFVALLTILGVLGFRHGVLPPLAARGVPTSDAADRARRLGLSALLLYAIAAVVRLYTESVSLHGVDVATDAGVILPLLTRTSWGIGWLVGAVGAVSIFAGWAISKRSVMIGTPLALTGALGLVLSPALSGHAASSGPFVLSVTLDMLHVAAAGVWIGGLLMVLVAGVPAMRRLADGNTDAAVSALVNSFHPLALFCAPLVVVAGVGMSWIRLGGFSAIWPTAYGRMLLLKVGLFLVVAAMGTYNSLRARRGLGAAQGTRHFRRTASLELLFAAIVLAVTTFLVVTPLPTDSAP
jgi:copper transport protein